MYHIITCPTFIFCFDQCKALEMQSSVILLSAFFGEDSAALNIWGIAKFRRNKDISSIENGNVRIYFIECEQY